MMRNLNHEEFLYIRRCALCSGVVAVGSDCGDSMISLHSSDLQSNFSTDIMYHVHCPRKEVKSQLLPCYCSVCLPEHERWLIYCTWLMFFVVATFFPFSKCYW